MSYDTAQLVFVCVYFIAVVIASFIINKDNLKNILYTGAASCLLLSVAGWCLPFLQAFYFLHVLIGLAAAMISIAFVYIFIYGFTPETRMQATAGFQLGVSLLTLLFTHVLSEINIQLAFAASCILLILLLLSFRFDAGYMPMPSSISKKPVPFKLLLVICFIMFIAYFNVRQQVNMIDVLSRNTGVDIFQDNLLTTGLEIAIYVLFLFFFYRTNRFILIYSCLILVALSYLAGIVAPEQVYIAAACYYASGCMSNLFAFTFIGDLALKYGRNFLTATLGLAGVGLGAIGGEYLGQLTSGLTGETMTSVVSVSLSTIFISFLIIPWLAKYVHDEMRTIMRNEDASIELVRPDYMGLEELTSDAEKVPGDAIAATTITTATITTAAITTAEASENLTPEAAGDRLSIAAECLETACGKLLEGNKLTPREFEIAVLLYERYDNETIAKRLFISPNTLKVHIRRIYQKFQVSRKREFILAVDHLCIDQPCVDHVCLDISDQREKITK
ncbi:MAG TPA: helix-turn-helix transcriptional regulator [Clostridia bacterium]|nr:helix-turn-helix transcriptional regulator [Clostridia bacterium]